MVKQFKFVTNDGMDKASKRYKNGGKNKNIYVHVFQNGNVETIEVFPNDIAFNFFIDLNEAYNYYNKTGW